MIIDSVPDVGAYNTIEQYKQAYNICKQDPLATYVNEDMRLPYVFRLVAVHIRHKRRHRPDGRVFTGWGQFTNWTMKYIGKHGLIPAYCDLVCLPAYTHQPRIQSSVHRSNPCSPSRTTSSSCSCRG